MSIGGVHEDLVRRAAERAAEVQAQATRQHQATESLRAAWGAEPEMIGDSYASESRWDYTRRRIGRINIVALFFFFLWYATWTVCRIAWFMTSARWTPDRKRRAGKISLIVLVGVPVALDLIAIAINRAASLF